MDSDAKYILNSDYHNGFLARSYASKDEFVFEYRKFYNEKSKAKELYLLLLTELEKSISEGNIVNFKKFYCFTDYIGSIESNWAFCSLKKTNLIILACKYDQICILKYIFGNILSNFCEITPYDKDGTCHNAFYYAIRSGNVQLLHFLINNWPDKYFSAHPEMLDEILSNVYENLKLKNVLLPKEMEIFVQKELINLRFYSSVQEVENAKKCDFSNIKKRAELVVENIEFLKTASGQNNKIDEEFLFVMKFLSQNLHVLKNQLKSTYNKLPWEEMELCLICFISSYYNSTKNDEKIHLLYRTTLNKIKILNYLEIFGMKLKEEIIDKDLMNIDKVNELPKLKREENSAEIISGCAEFEKLYTDFQKIRDVMSLEKMNYYVKIGLSTNAKEKQGRLILIRILQIISEFLKNTLQSPKLSTITSELILLSLSKKTRQFVIDLQNSKSCDSSFLMRNEILENADFLINFQQNDIQNLNHVLNNILHNIRNKTVFLLLKEVVKLEDFQEFIELFKNVELIEMFSEIFETPQIDKLKKLIQELNENVIDKTKFEKEQFCKINNIISEIPKCENNFPDHILSLGALESLRIWFSNSTKIMDDVVQDNKEIINKLLEHKFKFEADDLKKIIESSMDIRESVSLRVEDVNDEHIDKINKLIYEIFYIAEFEIEDDDGNKKWIEKLRGQFIDKISFGRIKLKENLFFDEEIMTSTYFNNQLALKLSELEIILRNYSSLEKFPFRNRKFKVGIEILLLDILSILEISKNLLKDNLLFFDEDAALLIGKCLLDHLAAQDNELLLLVDPSIGIILNANKFISEKNLTNKIGKFVLDDPVKLRNKFDERLSIITNQKIMFKALKDGNLETLKDSMKNGADINARCIDLKTALHFSAEGGNLKIVEFIKKDFNDFNLKDMNGQNPLHVAATNGRIDIINFFIKNGTDVNGLDNFGGTPLHAAAKNGHKDAVEILLTDQNNVEDKSGFSPLHYAITNHHTDVAKYLLEKQSSNVDDGEFVGSLTPLYIAAEFDNLELVNFLLKKNANVNLKTDSEGTALHVAAKMGYLKIVEILISNGADVNLITEEGGTSLHYAAANGHEMIVEILLKNGAKVNAMDKNHHTPLHGAVKNCHEKIVRLLLKFKANPNLFNIEGMTALHIAAKKDDFHIVNILIENGAKIRAKDSNNATPLHSVAMGNGNEKIAEILIKNGAEVNAKDIDNDTPLHIAALKGHKNFVELLIRNKANVNVKSVSDCMPIHLAALNGHKDILDILIKNKSKINEKSADGMTPLLVAMFRCHEDIAEILIKNKADVNEKQPSGFTALHYAAKEGFTKILKILIKNKAKINAVDNLNATPLYAAVEKCHKEVVEILIANGADMSIKYRNLYTPLMSAIKRNYCEIVGILTENQPVLQDAPLLQAVYCGYLEIVKILINKNPNIFLIIDQVGTYLHIAAQKGYKEIVNLLIENGAKINDTSCFVNGSTPLHLAAEEGYEEIVEILISKKAKLNIPDIDGDIPLHLAAMNGHSNIVEILIKNGSKIDLKDKEGRTPLIMAILHKHLKIAKILLKYKPIDLNSKLELGNESLLRIAIESNNLEMVKFLVNKGSDINLKHYLDSKCIHVAAGNGYKDIVEFFLQKGLNINDVYAENATLLHFASFKGQLEMMKFLISKNVDVNAKDAFGRTSMHIADNKDVVKILLKNHAFYNLRDKFGLKPSQMPNIGSKFQVFGLIDKLFEAVKNNNYLEVQNSIKLGAFVNALNAQNYAPLHYAAWKSHEEIVKILLENKADPNLIGHQNLTALHYAVKFSKFKIVKMLLSNGAIYNPISDGGKTPLEFAVNENIINLLKLIDVSFLKIRQNNPDLIDQISSEMPDMDTLKVLMNAQNREKKTILIEAKLSNYFMIENLKDITEGNLSNDIEEALLICDEGDNEVAIAILNNASEKIKRLLGPNNPANFDIMLNKAKICSKQGNCTKALKIYEKLYKKQKQMLGINNQDTLYTKSLIAFALINSQEKADEALKVHEEVFQKQKELLGSTHDHTLTTQFNLALILSDQPGNLEEALEIFQEILEKRIQVSGLHNLATINVQKYIAILLSRQGKYEEAMNLFQQVYETTKQIWGIDHHQTVNVLVHMAKILRDKKKYREALIEFKRVLSLQKKLLKENHPEMLQTEYNIANLLMAQGKYASAFKIYKDDLLDRMIKVFGPNNSIVLEISNKMRLINVKYQTIDGIDPLEVVENLQKNIFTAISKGDIKNIERLITDGVSVNFKDSNGRTPLHYAIDRGHTDIVKILLENDGDLLTQVTNKGNTSLHTACAKGSKKIVEILLQKKVLNTFLNAKTFTGGSTALHVAAKKNSSEIVKILLQNGAIYNIKNADGKIPIDLSNDSIVIDLLKLIDDLFKYVTNGNFNGVSKKLAEIKSVDIIKIITIARNCDGHTLLQVSMINKQEEITNKLLDKFRKFL